MKKFFTLFAAALLTSMAAMSQVVDGINYLITSDTTVLVDVNDPIYSGNIVIPATVTIESKEYQVTEIGRNAFSNCEELTSVVLPNSIKTIGNNAFEFCHQLASINLPEGLERIFADAFWECRSLTSLTLPSTLKEIDYYAFEYCTGLKTLTIPNSVETMGGWVCLGDSLEAPVYNNKFFVFLPYDYAENYTIPDGIEVVCEASCYENHYLKSVTIPASVKKINVYAFQNCENLTSVTLSEGLNTIDDHAFDGTAITSLALPASLTSLAVSALPATLETITLAEGNETFYMSNGCLIKKDDNSLIYAPKGAALPEGIVEIGNYAFKGRTDLTELVVPSTVKKIGYYAFEDCSNLTSITLPEGVTWIGSYAFQYCSSLKSITLPSTFNDLSNSAGLFYYCSKLESVTILGLPNYLPDQFFSSCDSLKSFNLPESVKDYGYNAFLDAGFTSPVLNSHLFARLPQEYKGAYAIPNGITDIGRYAFYMCDSLTEISFPATLHRIKTEAFWGCYSLTRIEVPEGVDSIESYAFEDCHNVETLILPSTLKYIESYAFSFYNESKLKEVYNYATTPYEFENGDEPFYDVPNIDKVKLYVPDASVDAYKAALYWQDFDVQPISNSPTAIDHVQYNKVQVTKRLVNGQLLIEHNGRTFNALGVEVK